MRRLVGGCSLFLVACGLVACGGTSEPVATSSEQASDAATKRTVEVTLTEGTNMALALAQDGTRVISLQGQLFRLDDAGEGVAITDAYHDAREPQFSPDGMKVAFHGYRGGNWDIFEVPADGSTAPEALTNDPFDDREPNYSHDGQRVVFASDRGGSYDIWQIAAGELTQLTDTEGNAYSPALNAAGELAYIEDSTGKGALIVQAPDGSRREVLLVPGTVSGVQWSPNGEKLSYQVLGPRGAQMRVVNADGSGDEAVSRAGSDVFPMRAGWQGDATFLFAADGLIQRASLADKVLETLPFAVKVTLERDIYERRQRDYDATVERQALGISTPVVDNSGSHIYFTALGDVWHWQPDTSGLARLTDDAATEYALSLHPDGGAIAYVGDDAGKLDLYIHDLADGTRNTINLGVSQISFPSWSPDGEKLAFFVDVPGNPLGGQLRVLELATGETQNVLAPIPAQPISWSEDSTHVAVTRLNAYSSRYREGIFELVVAPLAEGEPKVISPLAHQSILYVTLNGDDRMHYVQGGVLKRMELEEGFVPAEAGVAITDEVTDFPSFSANNQHLVYLSGDTLNLRDVATGETRDVTPNLKWRMFAPEDSYVVRAGRLFVGEGETYAENQDIFVEGSRIVAIQPASPDLTPDVDASDKTVVPGLFEMHAHMGETSEVQGRVWLANGITSVRDPGSNPYVAKERQESWDSGRRIGPRTYVTGYLTDGNRVFYSMAEGIVSDAHLEMALERTERLGLDFVKTYVRLPDHQQKRVVEFAHGIGIPVSSHELYPAVAHGMDHVEHIGGTSRRGYQPKVSRLGYSYQDVIELLSSGGMGITATAVLPGFAVIVNEEPDWFEAPQFGAFYGTRAQRTYQMMATRFGRGAAATAKANGKLLRALTERDALLVTGTDAPFVPYGSGLHAEFRLYARAGVPPAAILRQATLKSAQAAGVAGELGTIEAGKLADMVIVDGDPLNDIRDLDHVVMTIKHGQRYNFENLLPKQNAELAHLRPSLQAH